MLISKCFTFRKQIKEQIRDLKREMKNPSETPQDQELSKKRKISDSEEDNEILKDFHEQQKKYADIKTTRRGKGK
jgi:ethanolamine ammonia-lyase small subunit